jgi:hypothetical protein
VSQALGPIKDRFDALLIGFYNPRTDGFDLNPSGIRTITTGDVLLVISANVSALTPHANS